MDLTTADESEDTLHVECVCERAATAARAITRKSGKRFTSPIRHAGRLRGSARPKVRGLIRAPSVASSYPSCQLYYDADRYRY